MLHAELHTACSCAEQMRVLSCSRSRPQGCADRLNKLVQAVSEEEGPAYQTNTQKTRYISQARPFPSPYPCAPQLHASCIPPSRCASPPESFPWLFLAVSSPSPCLQALSLA